jgi:hypothetical protein
MEEQLVAICGELPGHGFARFQHVRFPRLTIGAPGGAIEFHP